jgi:YHS domain-containing protein
MKKNIIGLTAIAIMALGSCNNHTGKEGSDKMDASAKTVQIQLSDLATTQDLICGMKLEPGSIGDTVTYQGKIYGFCSSECKAEFVKDPQSHLTQK